MMAERLVEASGVELCTEVFGNPDEPPILALPRVPGEVEVDWSDQASVIEYLVGYVRMLAGD
jgi:hypothetical protein